MVTAAKKPLGHGKQSATDALKSSSKRFTQKIADATSNLTGNKIPNRITKVSKNSKQSISQTVATKHRKKKKD